MDLFAKSINDSNRHATSSVNAIKVDKQRINNFALRTVSRHYLNRKMRQTKKVYKIKSAILQIAMRNLKESRKFVLSSTSGRR